MKNTTVKPSDVRPVRAEGDHTVEPLYTAVGRALSAWGTFETNLGLLFGRFMLSGSSLEMAARVFGTIRTFEGRLEILKAAANLYFRLHPLPIEADFKKLANGPWREFGARRNELAHGVVQPYGLTRGTNITASMGQYYLVPSFIDASKWKSQAPPSYCYVADDVEHYAAEFGKLIKPVVRMMVEVTIHGAAIAS